MPPPQTWRLFADASNDVGLALEMLAPLPAFREAGRFLQLICLASVFKAACGVAGGATGAAITEHWAVDNNIADIGAKVQYVSREHTSKDGCQHHRMGLCCLRRIFWTAHCTYLLYPAPLSSSRGSLQCQKGRREIVSARQARRGRTRS